MNSLIFVIPILAVLDANGIPLSDTLPDGQGADAIQYLVTVNGKTYFYERTPHIWTVHGEYCQSLGLRPASITSTAEFSALNLSYSGDSFAGTFWTGGRDALSLRQFSWNATDQAVPTNLEYWQNVSSTFESCLAFRSNRGQSYLFSIPCNNSREYTLCETP